MRLHRSQRGLASGAFAIALLLVPISADAHGSKHHSRRRAESVRPAVVRPVIVAPVTLPRSRPLVVVAPRTVRPAVIVRPRRPVVVARPFTRPSSVFRPRVVNPAPYVYFVPVYPPTATSYDVIAPRSPAVTSFSSAAGPDGGVSFQITPAFAEVYADGMYVGQVGSFATNSTPLMLAPGPHYFELRSPGFRTLTFDATIRSGEVLPYQEVMQPIR
jgi:hypothetical protein